MGWSMSDRMTATLVTDSLEMALWKRRPLAGLLVHSDRGSQYASDRYQQLLSDNGFICSMSRKGNCWDNAVAESFFPIITVRESTRLMATWHRSCMDNNLPRQRKKASGKVLSYHYGIELIDEPQSRELLGYVEEHLERIKAGQTLVTF